MDTLRELVCRVLGKQSINKSRTCRSQRSRGKGLGLELLEDRCVPSSPGSNIVIDNTSPGFAISGVGWNRGLGGYGGNYLYELPGYTATANWNLGNLGVGTYDVQATWNPLTSGATNATYQVLDGKTLLASVAENQMMRPSGGITVGGTLFQDLGTFTLTSGTLTVVLGGSNTGVVVADAIHVMSLSAWFTGPSTVKEGTTSAQVSLSSVTGGSGSYTYSYDFNNSGTFEITNSTSASAKIPEMYLDDGPSKDVVRARVTDSLGNWKDFTFPITVTNVPPTPSFTPPSAIDVTLPTSFTGSATDPSTADTQAGFSYTWNFGDGSTGSGASASHTYTKAGIYTVRLTATDKDGGSSSISKGVTVHVLPSAKLTAPASVNEGSTTTAVTFASPTGGSGGYRYSYDFNNDGNFEITGSTSASATIPESNLDDGPSTLVVHGRITDSLGVYTDYTTSIKVNNVPPKPSITRASGIDATVATTFTASASDPSTADTNAGITYTWNFGDGSTGTGASASHSYAKVGTYTVTLTATDKDGGTGATTALVTVHGLPSATFSDPAVNEGATTATLNFTNPTGGSGGYTYSYDFNNDGNFEITGSDSASAVITESYLDDGPATVVMHGRITDSVGGYTDYTTSITVNDIAPVPTITPPSVIDVTVPATFTGSATSPSTADMNAGFSYSWNFGDGTTGTGASPSHTYAKVGTYTVTLSATDADGGSVAGTTSMSVTVIGGISATFSGPSSVSEGTTTAVVTFSNPIGGSGGYTYSYDFNNDGTFEITGSSSATSTIPESYVDDGPATLVVHGRITDSLGGYVDYTTTITVTNVTPIPSITPPFSLTAGSAGTFTASATDPSTADTKAGFTYTWNFGDGGSGSGANPSYTYASAGTYTVTLTATDKDGGVGTVTSSLTVNAATIAKYLEFGTTSSPTAEGYTQVTEATNYSATLGYGWQSGSISSRDRGTSDDLTRAFDFTTDGSFALDLPNGNYDVTLTMGDAACGHDQMGVYLEGVLTDTVSTATNQFVTNTYTVNVSDGQLNLRLKDLGGSDPNVVINALTVWVHGQAPNPSATFNAPSTVKEGISTATVAFANATGGSGGYTYSYDFNNSGNFEITGSSSNSTTIPEAYLDDGPSTVVVHGRITDSNGKYKDYTTSITVNNVAPTPSIGLPSSPEAELPSTFNASATDPSTADTNNGFTYAWNFGDGGTGSGANPSYTYATAGTYTVTLTATDKDGGTGIISTSITVAPLGENHNPYITTPYDNIPNSGQSPTIFSTQSGNWSDPTTWSLGRLPTTGDVVSVDPNTTVTYDLVSTSAIDTVVIQTQGHLDFRTDINTQLMVTNLLVLAGGELQVGTVLNPISASVKAQIIFSDIPINTTTDPAQYGHGLIALGKVTMCGATKSATYVTLGTEAHARDSSLTLSQPVSGWQVGDRLVLPDSRQLTWEDRPDNPAVTPSYQWETVTVAGVSADGLTITLTAPLQFDHLGSRDANGALTFMPYVGDLTRNVVVRSANAQGTRGHVFFTGRADVDIQYAQFSGLGRTKVDPLDNTTYDQSGNVTHVGTNEQDRYGVEFSHLIGPSNGQTDGYQYTFVGNSVFCPLDPMPFRWGIAINDSDYGLIQGNVLYNWAGAGIAAPKGTETGNVIADNYIVRITGNGSRPDDRTDRDVGYEGAGLWFRGYENYVRGNVVADAPLGYVFWANGLWNAQIPTGRGADPSVSGQYQIVNMMDTPMAQFDDNEAFGGPMSVALAIWSLGTNGVNTYSDAATSTIHDMRIWNVYEKGYYGYETNRLTIDGFIFRGDIAALLANQGPTALYSGDYVQKDFLLEHADIQDALVGFFPAAQSGGGTQTIQDSYLRNYINVELEHIYRYGSTVNPDLPRVTVIRNVQFSQVNVPTIWAIGPQQDIVLIDQRTQNAQDIMQRDEIDVYAFNGNTQDNFRVYYLGQAADAVVPQAQYNTDGSVLFNASPVAGLTNQQVWDQYGVAVGGSVAPTTATQRDDITGLVDPF
jgi:PKD repeat protein